MRMAVLGLILAAGGATGLAAARSTQPAEKPHAKAIDPRGSRFIGLRDFLAWTRSEGGSAGEIVMTSPEIDPELAWDQLIASWNADMPDGAGLRIEARGVYSDAATKYYTLGLWSTDEAKRPRESVNGQKDSDGDVQTDTLVLNRPGARLQLRITLASAVAQGESASPKLRFVGLSFLDSAAHPEPLAPERAAWGKTLAAPERCQLSYEGGEGWCSATSTSMALGYWADKLKRPGLNKDVPEVAKGVNDRVWGGTGNWPFNTAYAGGFSGMRAYVTRFSDVSELEQWIAAGIPVVCSVSYKLLKGGTEPEAGGHLVVCVGFTKTGDVVVNDPWAHLEKGETVRKTFPRKNLIAGWANSHNTVYLIYPESVRLPQDRFGHWEQTHGVR